MFSEHLDAAIDGARTLTQLDHLSRTIWQGHAAGAIADVDAQRLAERLHAARGATRKTIVPVGIPLGRVSIFPPRRPQYSPDRARSIMRRRRLVASGPMPPALADCFTWSELAVLRIVADAVKRQGCCDRSIAEIAARAGVSRTTVQNAHRRASQLGLIVVQERRRQGQVSLPNVVRVVSREWLAWIKRSGAMPRPEPIGFKKIDPTDTQIDSKTETGESPDERRLFDKSPTAAAKLVRPVSRETSGS